MNPTTTPSLDTEAVAYVQKATGNLLLIEAAGPVAMQLRNLNTSVKTLTIRKMVRQHVLGGLLLPIKTLQDLQHLQDLQTGQLLQVL
jgi:hypothetical protein